MPKRPTTKAKKRLSAASLKPPKKLTTKASTAKPTSASQPSETPRVLRTPKLRWYAPLTWRYRPPAPRYKPLPKARLIFWKLLGQLWQSKKTYGGIIAIYGVLMLLLVRGLSSANDLSTIKDALKLNTHGLGGQISSAFTSFVYLAATPGASNSVNSGIYQTILILLCSLAFIWAHRQISAGHVIRIRDSFYAGMAPLVPFLLLFLLMGVQLLPLGIGSWLYSTVIANGIAVHWWEQIGFGIIFLGVAIWSLRMITASIFALYIVTLPDMTPLKAYRSARQLVYRRRLLIWRKLIFLPVVIFVAVALLELPLILFVTPAAVAIFFVSTLLLLPLINGYLYNLYREML